MMPRDTPTMKPPLAALALAACVSALFGSFGVAEASHPVRKIPKIEIKLTGPVKVGENQSLESTWFHAVLTNRSAEPLILFVRNGLLMNARWHWSVTDAQGQPVRMAVIERGYCGTVPYSEEAEIAAHKLHDADFLSLAPGESREFGVPGGPSDDYTFPYAGTYRLAVTLTYVPPNSAYYFDSDGHKQSASGYEQWDLSQLGVDSLHAVQNSLSVEGRSDVWNITLPAPRTHPDAVSIETLEQRFDKNLLKSLPPSAQP
jgi:hypothetical protein